MKTNKPRCNFSYLSNSILLAIAATSVSINAQESNENQTNSDETIVVTGTPVMRDRTDAISPELEYGVEFFQRFEPTSVGDMLKRTPGISFSSDVGEYDAPQMRGLGEGYTQVLINGRKIPGAGSDRAVFVDRIPAEMVKSIQIVRSPSADQDSAGVGGTINIILKDGATFQGGSVRLGVLSFDGNEFRKSSALAYGGDSQDRSWTFAANFQERYVPKLKWERVFDPEDNSLKSEEREDDVRDSDDLSLSGTLAFELSDTSSLEFAASYVSTVREEDQNEVAYEFDDGEKILDKIAMDDVDIEEDSYLLSANYYKEINLGTELESYISFSKVENQVDVVKFEKGDFDDPWEYDAIEEELADDQEIQFGTKILSTLSNDIDIRYGFDFTNKERNESITEWAVDSETGIIEEVDLFQAYDVTEDRVDLFFVSEIPFGIDSTLELGARVEHTKREIEGEILSSSISSTEFNPSAHYSWKINDATTFRASLAKTVRRPDFKQLSPNIELDEPEDGDAKQGNPLLENEVSVGIDMGVEYMLANRGIFGINAFYRDVSDAIEQVGSGVAPGGGILFTYDNTGDGKVWGVEFDLNKPLGDNTVLFANLSLLDSEIVDQFTGKKRRFRDQSDHIYNVGITHNMPDWDASMGFSYQKQGDSLSVDIHRDVTLSYDGNLEIFIEKRFGEDYVLRLTGTNLLDAHKFEYFELYDGDSAAEILQNHINRNIDEIETEDESAGRVITLTFRAFF